MLKYKIPQIVTLIRIYLGKIPQIVTLTRFYVGPNRAVVSVYFWGA